jgi:DNA-binding NarL/FixJ family response regulator
VAYSFSDQHFNEAIRDGIRAGLRVYVLSPESPDALAARLQTQKETGEIVWRGLAGYFQVDFKTLFPVDRSTSAEWNFLRQRFSNPEGTGQHGGSRRVSG